MFIYFIRNMGLRWSILQQSRVQISYDGLKNNLNDSHVRKAWCWHQKGAKVRKIQGNWSLRVQNTFYSIISEIWDLDSPYCTNLKCKLVMIVKKTIWMILISKKLDFDTRKVQEYVKFKEIDLWGAQKWSFMLYYQKYGI